MQQHQNQGSQNRSIEKRINKIGKPKGMNSQKPLDKTNAWSSDQQSTQAIQTLSRFGRFICFQQTGTRKHNQEQDAQNNSKFKQINNDMPGVFLNTHQIQIVKQIGTYCEIIEKIKKNCVVFFFGFTYPEFKIQDGLPVLVNSYQKYERYPSLLKIAPMLTQKFLEEYYMYLEYQETGEYISDLYSKPQNQNLKDAETLLQCLFTKYIIGLKEIQDLEIIYNFQSTLENHYQNFYNLPEKKKEYEECVIELLACMQVDEESDKQYENEEYN